jgi:DegV family protein with EDD domain
MVRIVCDSSNSLPDELLARLHIIEVPALVNVPTAQGTVSYRNKVELSIDDFYQILTTSDKLPTTSQPSPQDFADAYGRVDPGDAILCITVSTKLSGTYVSAVGGMELVPERPVTVWDGHGASLDSGFQVIVAAEMAQQGHSLAEIVAKLPSVRENTWTFFTTENLKYLAASGRVPRLRATVGDLLNVRPIIHFEHDGTIEPAGQIRGRKRSLDELINRAYHLVGDRPVRAAIVHANCPEEAAQFAIEVRGRLHAVDLTTNEIGPVLAALAGPNTLGLAVYVL